MEFYEAAVGDLTQPANSRIAARGSQVCQGECSLNNSPMELLSVQKEIVNQAWYQWRYLKEKRQ
jgi:hypothetical protein